MDGRPNQEITEVGVTFESNEGWAREDFFEARVQLHQVEVAEQYVPDRQIVGVERQNSHCAIIFVTRSLGGENCRTWESTNTLQSCEDKGLGVLPVQEKAHHLLGLKCKIRIITADASEPKEL